jgi:hypothetical protein
MSGKSMRARAAGQLKVWATAHSFEVVVIGLGTVTALVAVLVVFSLPTSKQLSAGVTHHISAGSLTPPQRQTVGIAR